MSAIRRRSASTIGQRSALRPYLGVVASATLLLAAGIAHRVVAAHVGTELATPIRLDLPLSTLPMQIADWQGEEVPLPDSVLRIAGNDDYVSRNYRHRQTGETVHLYVGYTARPRTMLRHRPSVCYPSAGWAPLTTAEGTIVVAVPASSGASASVKLPIRLQSFLKAGMPEQRVIVLNYYVLNGRPTIDENSFWGLTWRDPNRRRDPTRYVAQVQLAAVVRTTPEAAASTLRQFAIDSAPLILPLLPASPNAATSPAGVAP